MRRLDLFTFTGGCTMPRYANGKQKSGQEYNQLKSTKQEVLDGRAEISFNWYRDKLSRCRLNKTLKSYRIASQSPGFGSIATYATKLSKV
jgi:hypothetical protein